MIWPFWLVLTAAVSVAYLAGSISFAVIAGRLFQGIDIREEGSGNAGTTNVFRVIGWKIGILVLAADLLKGFIPVFFVVRVFETSNANLDVILQGVVLASVLIGHTLPLWFGFRGGKGVASAAGGVIAIYPPVAPACLVVFVVVLAVSRYVSLSSCFAAWTLPVSYALISGYLTGDFIWWLMVFFIIVASGVTFLHRKNIRRLVAGQEKRI